MNLPHLLNYFPDPVETVPVVRAGTPRILKRGDTFTVLTWNLQFCAGRGQSFFFEGGTAVRVEASVVHRVIQAVAQQLRSFDADLVLLQEVDRNSDRTARIDALVELLEQAPYPVWTGCPYHRSRFVPKPWPLPMGRVDLWQVILSRFDLRHAQRLALPLLRESPLVQRFNLKRALLTAELALAGGALHVGNTHLSAWSYGDGTVPRQIAQIKAWMDRRAPWLLGGDFNALPPGDDPARLSAVDRECYEAESPMSALIPGYTSVIPEGELLETRNRTYLPPGQEAPERMLDYLFVSPEVEVLESRVLSMDPWISDHWPVWARLRLR